MTISRDRIGGELGLSALDALTGRSYDDRAQRHRPTDPAALAAEVRRLNRTGLSPLDIAAALRIDLAQVRNVLGSAA